jgi:hypothetical protein
MPVAATLDEDVVRADAGNRYLLQPKGGSWYPCIRAARICVSSPVPANRLRNTVTRCGRLDAAFPDRDEFGARLRSTLQ